MKKILLGLLLFFSLIGITFCIAVISEDNIQNSVTYEQIEKIKPVFVITDSLLLSENEEEIIREISKIDKELIKNKVLLNHPIYGSFIDDSKLPYFVNIIIDSHGGLVNNAKIISEIMLKMNSQGIFFNCFTNKAASSAFYVLITACHKRIGLGEPLLLTHETYYEGNYTDVSTKIQSKLMSDREAISLKLDKELWLEVSRKNGDKMYTKKEIEKYKLLDGYYAD